MAIRTALLNWNNITRDTDFSKYIESVSEPWVIDWLEVTSTKVWIWKAWVLCERTNGDTIYALVYNTSEVTISWNGDVYIQVNQTYIDNGELANEDGTWIATISVGTMPSKNALKLATISSGTVTDARNMIKKLDEFNTEVESIFEQLSDLDERVEHLEEAWAIDHLEESGVVWELYTLSDKLFKQYAPKLADCTLEANVWDVADNTQVHIQAIGSGVASNTLKLKVKKSGAPTTALYVEVRKWIQVTVTENEEAYWYGDSSNIIATGNLAYTNFSSDFAEVTFTLNNEFWATKGEILDIVVYQASNTVNASNYYVLACDSTQYSEAFSYVSVNGVTRTRSKLMPYVLSNGFLQSLLCKAHTRMSSNWISAVKEYWELTSFDSNTTILTYYNNSPHELTAYASFKWGWAVSFQSTAQIISSNWQNKTVTLYTNWMSDYAQYRYQTWTVTVPANWSVSLVVKPYNSGWPVKLSEEQILYTTPYKIKKKENVNIVWFAKENNVQIWKRLSMITFWEHSTWIKGYLKEQTTSNTAETGYITLWNAVGFINYDLNGTIVKIPYYN